MTPEWEEKIRETRKRMEELNDARCRMVREREKPRAIRAVSREYLLEVEKLKVYEWCAAH